MKRDRVFSDHHPEISEFAFDARVASVFGDMLKRSVPGYGTVLSMIAVFAKKYATEGSTVYDLGASLGGATFAAANNIDAAGVTIKAYDNSESMVARLRELVDEAALPVPIECYCDDIAEVTYENASVVILNLTLQFLKPEERLPLLKKIASAMKPGGLLLLTEKLSDPSDDGLITELYYDFKRANSYSDLEISQKRTALENVMITDTEEQHIARLHEAGFTRVERWFQTLLFRAYAAWI